MQNNIGNFISAKRKALGLTQQQLADKLNVTDKAVSKWERGQGLPDISLVLPLAGALQVPADTLLRGLDGGGSAEGETSPQDGGPEGPAPADAAPPGAFGSEDLPVQAVATTLQYAQTVQSARRAAFSRIALLALSAGCAIAILVCLICDYALNQTVTWFGYVLPSVLYTWLVTAPLLWFRRRPVVACLLSVTAFTLPLLAVLSFWQGGNWFARVALQPAILGLLLMWLLYWVYVKSRMQLLFKLAITVALVGVVDLLVDLGLVQAAIQTHIGMDTIFSLVGTLAAALILFMAGLYRRGYKKRNEQ